MFPKLFFNLINYYITPPRTREIRSMRGRYASYWNAFLLFNSIVSMNNRQNG